MMMGIGGGIDGYTGTAMRASSEVGGGWDARVVLETRTRVGFMFAYVGSATALDATGLEQGATLLGNGAEGSVRLNILTGQWRPFVSAGLAWRHYSLVNTELEHLELPGRRRCGRDAARGGARLPDLALRARAARRGAAGVR